MVVYFLFPIFHGRWVLRDFPSLALVTTALLETSGDLLTALIL